jgi:hypothetical protein
MRIVSLVNPDIESFHRVLSLQALSKTICKGNLSNWSADDRQQSNKSLKQSPLTLARGAFLPEFRALKVYILWNKNRSHDSKFLKAQ